MQTLSSLAIAMGMVLIAAGIGRGLRVLTRSDKSAPSERLVIDTSLGLGILSLVIFAISALQLLRPAAGIIFAVVLVAAAIPGLPGVFRDLITLLKKLPHPGSIGSCLVTELLLVLAIAALIPALAPPTMSDWDSLAYHLAVPKLFIQHGGFYYIPFTTHSNFPFLMEMLYVPGLALNDPVAAKLMNYFVGVLLVAAVVVLTRRHISPRAAPIAALGIASMPIVMWEATTAYVDLATALYTIVALHLLLNYLDTRERPQLTACAVAAGFAASTKMTGLAVFPMLAVWLLVSGGRSQWKHAAKLCGIALLVCLPWYVKSLIYTGNPVYPFFYSIFGGRDWSAELAANYTTLQQHFGLGHSPGAFLLLPYNLTFHSEAFYDRPGLYIGPLLLIALPILVFSKYRSSKLVAMAAFFVAQLVVWFSLSHQSRYLIPAFAVLSALVSGLCVLDDRLRRTRAVLLAALAATAVFGLVTTLWPQMRETACLAFGYETREAYLTRQLDVYPAQQFINYRTPRDAKIALFGDTRGFFLDRPYAWADYGHNSEFSRDFDSADDLAGYLRYQGFTHALVNFGIAFPKREKAADTALRVYEAIESGAFQRTYPASMYGSVAVYKIR